MRISRIVKKKIWAVPIDETVLSAVRIMNKKSIGCIIVMKGKTAAGIITERDILRRIVAAKKPAEKTLCKGIMSKPLITIDENEHIEDAIDLMIRKKIKKLVVMRAGNVKGIITATDILRSGENIEFAALKKLAEFFDLYEPAGQAG